MESNSELQNSPELQGKTNAKSISETGHAKNVANFLHLISFCQGYGTTYNPSNERLKIPQLENDYQTALQKINKVRIQKTNFDNHTNHRRSAFEDLKPFATRIINAFIVSGADKLAIEDAKAINKKIQGITPNRTTTSATESDSTTTSKTISTSQQSYDRKIEHLANLIEILSQNEIYNPNEEELKVASIRTKLALLQSSNNNLTHSYTDYSNSLIDRNKTLYNPTIGLIQTAKEVKLYIKSVFGATSPQYDQVSQLEFKIRTED